MNLALSLLLVALLLVAVLCAYALGSALGYAAGVEDAWEACNYTHPPGSDFVVGPIPPGPGAHPPGTIIKP